MLHLPSFYQGSGEFYKVSRFEKGYPGIYRISGEVKKCIYPSIFDMRFKPVSGKVKNIWTTSYELESALKHKEVKIDKIDGFIWFEKDRSLENPFKRYVYHFWELKNKTPKDDPYYLFYKTLLNSLYGKFIQRTELIDEDGRKIYVAGSLYNPFIATLVTGFVRAMIHDLEHRFHSIHTATDSIMTLKPISDKYLGESIGSLKFETKGRALILRNKLYVIKNGKGETIKYALHGFRGSPEDLLRMYKNRNFSYEYEKMNRFRESMIQGLIPFIFEKKMATLNIEI
jgi:hypothetical protein